MYQKLKRLILCSIKYREMYRSLSEIKETKICFNLLAMEILTRDEGKIYSADFFHFAIMQRSIELIDSFVLLMKNGKISVAFSLVRIHLDSLLKLHALTKVNNTDLFIQTLEWKKIGEFKDKNGNKLTDKFLCESIEKEYGLKGVYEVYKATSKFIHFSRNHLDLISKGKEKGYFVIHMSLTDDINFNEKDASNVVKIFSDTNAFILNSIESLVWQRNNPNVMKLPTKDKRIHWKNWKKSMYEKNKKIFKNGKFSKKF